MTKIEWNESLKRHIAFQDADHQEAVELMNAMQDCSDEELPALFKAHFEHLRAHFTREHELMERTGFFAYDCHAEEHMRVLKELQALPRVVMAELAEYSIENDEAQEGRQS